MNHRSRNIRKRCEKITLQFFIESIVLQYDTEEEVPVHLVRIPKSNDAIIEFLDIIAVSGKILICQTQTRVKLLRGQIDDTGCGRISPPLIRINNISDFIAIAIIPREIKLLGNLAASMHIKSTRIEFFSQENFC